jgi:hypothetical protein
VIQCKYERTGVWGFQEGLACVRSKVGWGFINKAGIEVIPLKYDNESYFIDGLAKVSLNSEIGYIDINGTKYWED